MVFFILSEVNGRVGVEKIENHLQSLESGLDLEAPCEQATTHLDSTNGLGQLLSEWNSNW